MAITINITVIWDHMPFNLKLSNYMTRHLTTAIFRVHHIITTQQLPKRNAFTPTTVGQTLTQI